MTPEQKVFEKELHRFVDGVIAIHQQWLDGLINELEMKYKIKIAMLIKANELANDGSED